jgi:hypothetical protein
MLGKSSLRRMKILFKFLDTDNDKIEIKLSRIILAVDYTTFTDTFTNKKSK